MTTKNDPKQTNLDSFLVAVTPVISSDHLIKEKITNLDGCWHSSKNEKVECFRLKDLWDRFEEWSAYGVPVQITLQGGETITQHFVPYLSAIQIFTSKSVANSIRMEKKEEGCTSSGSESNGNSNKPWEGNSSSEAVHVPRNIMPLNERLGSPYFQFIEYTPPFNRRPLWEKIFILAKSYPGLMSLRSVDLSPASWMSVAWYPIYTIPMGRYYKDLSTCFLTYHTLSFSFQGADLKTVSTEGAKGNEIEDGTPSSVKLKRKEGEGIHLPPFGLAHHKMHGGIWLSDMKAKEQKKLVMLYSVADSWLKQLGVHHPDFSFFSDNRH